MSREEFGKLVAGLALVFAGFQWAATVLASDRGQAGVLIAALVVAALLAVQRLFFAEPFAAAVRALGLGPPALRGLLVAAVLCLVLLLVLPAYGHFTQVSLDLLPGWIALLPGLFAQAGIAEETLFRGYLFGRLRRRHSFWRAAWMAMVPFVIVHLLMFATLPWPIAAAALFLAAALSFPLAHLFEVGGHTIWAPALVHFVVQGALKVTVVSGDSAAAMPLAWMAACATIPFLVFLVPRPAIRLRP
jgi:membrane protease YdiL (CAAX protease family)